MGLVGVFLFSVVLLAFLSVGIKAGFGCYGFFRLQKHDGHNILRSPFRFKSLDLLRIHAKPQ